MVVTEIPIIFRVLNFPNYFNPVVNVMSFVLETDQFMIASDDFNCVDAFVIKITEIIFFRVHLQGGLG